MSLGARGRAYCRGSLKRGFDLALAVPAVATLSPLLLLIGVAVVLLSGRPILFAQERVGLEGRLFRLWKFRTMRASGARGPSITAGGDKRVTPIGRLLRATKCDELPQLFNVIRGEMSLVGPRPEVPRYVASYTAAQRRVLDARPGVTDPASLRFRNEEAILGSVDEERREELYVGEILPEKLRMNLEYIDRAGLIVDLGLILKTVKAVIVPARA